jgi:hypothetical protein
LKGLQSGLFSSIHDTANLQIVSDYHEELRIRLMMLDHLVDREVPWVYLERALNCVLEKVVLLDRDASNTSQTAVVALPQVSARVSVWREKPVWWRRLFAGNRASRSASKKPRQSLAVRASAAACQRFERLPEYLKRLSLIYHFMEMDDLNLLDKMRLVPSLGRHFSLQGTIAVFDAEDLGECFWGERLRQGSSEPIAKTVEELKEKLRKKGYHEGVSSSFTASAEGESREQRSPPTQMLA